MRKILICAMCSVLFALVLVPLAGAGKPTREFIPASDFTISGSCAFDVGVHVVGNKEYGITFSDGATLVTGALKVQLTNLADQSKSIGLNIPGPGLFTATAGGGLRIDARGPWLVFAPGMLLYVTGHTTLGTSPTGEFSVEQRGGTSTNLCSVLA